MGSSRSHFSSTYLRRDDSWLWRLFTRELGRLGPLALADFPFHPLGHSPGGQRTSGSRSGKEAHGGKVRADGSHCGGGSGCPRDSVRLRVSEEKYKRILSWPPGYGGSHVALWGIDLN